LSSGWWQRCVPIAWIYNGAVRTALILLWKASNCLCTKRLRPFMLMLIDGMEGQGHRDLDLSIKAKLRQMSTAAIDRS